METTIKWYNAQEKRPLQFQSVMGHMVNAFPSMGVRECYMVGDDFYFPAIRQIHEIDMWAYYPEFDEGDSL